MKSKKLIIALIAAAVVAAGGFASITLPRLFAQPAAAEPAPAQVEQSPRTTAEGQVTPSRSAALSLSASGRVAEILVGEGDQVAAGQVIMRLDDVRLAAAVAQAEAALARAQARLAELKAGALPGEVTFAQAAVDSAQAKVDRLASDADVRSAQAAVASAEAALAKLREGAGNDRLIAARAELANAAAVRAQAQAAYDRVKDNANIGARPESVALEQATNAYEAAAARLADLARGASAADLAGARARVAQAQAQLDALVASRPADVAAAQAALRQAQAQFELTRNGARPEAIAAAEADVAAAQAALDGARAALAETELRAPFAGVIAELRSAVGEQVTPGAVVAQVADLAAWQIETTDLTELNVVRIKEGAAVTITYDALPGETFQGTVARIRAIGENQKGEISYTVIVRPERSDPRLRWNMTAAVDFSE